MYGLTWLLVGLIVGWLLEFGIDYLFWQRRCRDSAADLLRLRRQIGDFEIRIRNAEQSLSDANTKLRDANASLEKAQQDLTNSYSVQDGLRKNVQVLEERVDNWGRKIGLIAGSEGLLSRLGTAFSADGDDELKSQIAAMVAQLGGQINAAPEAINLASSLPSAAEMDKGASSQLLKDPLHEINGIGAVFEQRLNQAGIYTFRQMIEAGAQRLHQIIAPKEWQAVDTTDWIVQAQDMLQK